MPWHQHSVSLESEDAIGVENMVWNPYYVCRTMRHVLILDSLPGEMGLNPSV